MKCIWILSLLVLNLSLIDACQGGVLDPSTWRMIDPVPSGEVVNVPQLELLAVSEFVATILSGKTPMELFKENDADNNGCVDFDETLNWITSHRNSVDPLEMAAEAGFALYNDIPMDVFFAKTMEKMVKQKIDDGQGMKAIFAQIVGKEDGCYTVDQAKQWAGL